MAMADPVDRLFKWMECLEQKWTALEDRVTHIEDVIDRHDCKFDEIEEREAERDED
jgi:hypothetical protein